ncbi:uncharacterized protein [Dysidea avara]|uniref:uncharacterized protein n=1 Tax=Dysidea avara TaxID=196820 RepID=UPI0033328E6E
MIREFGNVYVTSMPLESRYFDHLCKLARKEMNKSTAEESGAVKAEENTDASTSSKRNKPRRQRCKSCNGCLAKDCGKCIECRDKVKFGGPGKLKQCCINRKCIKILKETISSDVTEDIPSPKRCKCEITGDDLQSEGNKVAETFSVDASSGGCQDKNQYSIRLYKIWNSKSCYKFAAIIGKYKIHESSFHTLKGVQYLNDEIVNGFLSVLAETRNKTRHDTFVISSQLTTAIIDRTDRVPRNLFRKVKFASQSLLIGMYNQVVHFEHWIFVAIDIPNKMFYFLDPLKHSDLAKIILFCAKKRGIDDSLLLDDYKIIQIKSRIQYDDYNCGVLSLKLAKCVMSGGSVIKVATLYRLRIVLRHAYWKIESVSESIQDKPNDDTP